MKTLKLHYRGGFVTSVRWGAFPPEWIEPIYDEKDVKAYPKGALPDTSHITFNQRIFKLRSVDGNVAHYYEDLPAKIKEVKEDTEHGKGSQPEVGQSGPFMGKSGI